MKREASAIAVKDSLVEHHRANRLGGLSLDTMMVSASHVETMLEERMLLVAHVENLRKLLQRRPKATNSMFVGSDSVSWGKQAASLVRNMKEDLL